jgi:uncharacterized radical SAM superfamily protein
MSERKIVYSTCKSCHGGCGVKVTVEDGVIVHIEGNPDSLTRGTMCAKGLSSIQHVDNPYRLKYPLKRDGAKGCLVSGGCLPDGSVPLDEFVPQLGKIKRELSLTVFVHTGIINLQTAQALKAAGIDAALIDVLGSQETIKKTFNTSTTLQDYSSSLGALEASGLCFVPHVIVGLNEGKLDGELQALKMISHVTPSALVIIAFMPLRGTAMAKTSSPSPLGIAKVAAAARLMFPQTPLVLGCMRPKGASRAETDVLTLKAGVDAVAFPADAAVNYARNKGFRVSFSPYCCAQIYADVAKDF